MSSITLSNLTKRYADGFEAVKGIDVEVADGEFIILVGPSGCGKSTALRMIAGLEDITDGELRIGDEVVNQKAPKDRDIAMVFQNYALYPHMTVRDNMGFALKLAKVDEGEITRKVDEAAKILDLSQHLERKPANLSGGQRQRVAMGRAIVRDPAVFLMDEPLSNLDAKLRVQTRTEVSRIQQRLGTTMIYVTHDQTEAMTLGDRVAVMRAGTIQQVASPKELYEQPVNLFVAGFIGSPAMNFFPAELRGGRIHLPFGDVAVPAGLRDVPEGKVIAGVRPESFEDAELAPEHHQGESFQFDTEIELVESMGSELYAYFTYEGETASSAELEEIASDAGLSDVPGAGETGRVVTRLSPDSGAASGQTTRLWLDVERIHLFDPHDGHRLHDAGDTAATGAAGRSEPAA
jgi:multiple sugar transport system ATP-binding protein